MTEKQIILYVLNKCIEEIDDNNPDDARAMLKVLRHEITHDSVCAYYRTCINVLKEAEGNQTPI